MGTGCAGAPPRAPAPSAAPSLSGLYDVSGHQVFLDCRGSGAPTAVLDAGLGNPSSVWLEVQRQASAGGRVCRWDRPGLGRSPRAPAPRDSRVIATELRDLLRAARIPGPYVLVGASFGGLNAQYFARTWPGEVAGVVLVDAVHPDLDRRIVEIGAEDRAERADALSRNEEGIRYDDLLRSDEQVRAAPRFPAVPLYVLRHGVDWDTDPDFRKPGAEGLWQELQRDLAAQSPCSRLLGVPDTSHRIHDKRPDVVARAVVAVRAAARGSAGCATPEPVPL
jgi:pimeloyl-ACP methyl ester carboxylesterase